MSDDIEFTATARETDRALARIDGRIDWLSYLTPTNLDAVAEGFRDSGYKVLPELEYPPIPDGSTCRCDSLAISISRRC